LWYHETNDALVRVALVIRQCLHIRVIRDFQTCVPQNFVNDFELFPFALKSVQSV